MERPFDIAPRTVDLLALQGEFAQGREVTVVAEHANGVATRFPATVRIDTPQEIRYYQHGGILPYVLRQLVAQP